MTRPLIALSVPRLKFRYDHSDCTWPWPEMAVTKLDVLDLLNLPRQTGAVPLCTMRVLELDFHGVEQVRIHVCVCVCVYACACVSALTGI